MAHTGLYICCKPRVYLEHRYHSRMNIGMQSCRMQLVRMSFPSNVLLKTDGDWDLRFSSRGCHPTHSSRNTFICRSLLQPGNGNEVPVLKGATTVLKWSFDALSGSNLFLKLMPAVSVVAFAAWGLDPLIRLSRAIFLNRSDDSWEKSSSHHIIISYVQPLLMWAGVALICRTLDPVVLPTEASQAVKLRVLNFTRSLSTVLAFAQCLSSLIQQAQKCFAEGNDDSDAKNMGFSFAGKAVYSAVWVSAISLFMELLGFSTHKLLTAGGFGTVLLTLSSRELFTNFLSSVMIHATRPFIVNERIKTKISGYEVSGTVEQVGWWSPTIVRGDDREAVHVPNHKFAVSVVRNISQKSHWRIKTHLAISHMDADKINSIVADMRKVLAKNPQIEQQKLHRRVFLENIDPENQSLMIMVSCFVKTSHSEQYLRVKEDLLLDLLGVISHHRARLATPIRTVQDIDFDEDFENLPFSDGIYSRSRRGVASRALLLKESSYKIHSDEKSKVSSRNTRTKEGNKEENIKVKPASATDLKSDPKKDNKVNMQTKAPLKDKTRDALKESATVASSEFGSSGKAGKDSKRAELPKIKLVPPLEDNIVLGVALDGSKRMLPIDEETVPSAVPAESKEMTAQSSGSRPSKIDTKDSSQVSGTSS